MTRLRDGIAVPSKHDQGCDLLYRPRLDKTKQHIILRCHSSNYVFAVVRQ